MVLQTKIKYKYVIVGNMIIRKHKTRFVDPLLIIYHFAYD